MYEAKVGEQAYEYSFFQKFGRGVKVSKHGVGFPRFQEEDGVNIFGERGG